MKSEGYVKSAHVFVEVSVKCKCDADGRDEGEQRHRLVGGSQIPMEVLLKSVVSNEN